MEGEEVQHATNPNDTTIRRQKKDTDIDTGQHAGKQTSIQVSEQVSRPISNPSLTDTL